MDYFGSLSLGDKSEYFKRNFKSGRNFRWQKISGNFCFVSITLKRHWPCVIKDIWTFANHMAPLRNGLWTWDHYSKCIINHSKIIWTIIKLQLIFLLFFTQKQTLYACLFLRIFRIPKGSFVGSGFKGFYLVLRGFEFDHNL